MGKYLAILQDNPPEPDTEEDKLDKIDRKERITRLLQKRDK